MNPSQDKSRERSDAPILGPAVPPRPEPQPGDGDSLESPLAPFFAGRSRAADRDAGPAPSPRGEEATLRASGEETDLPWLAAEPDDVVPIETLVAEPDPEPSLSPGPETPQPAVAAGPLPDPPGLAGVTSSPRPGEPTTTVEGPSDLGRLEPEVVKAAADRLERIAGSLRSRSPSELLSGTADPLELLVVGYLLGHAERDPQPGSAPRDPLA